MDGYQDLRTKRQIDFISNLNDVDDCGVSNQIFDSLNSLWGPFEVD